MKALTLWEPWATLVAYGYKKFETRSWSTNYRGTLIIHAAKRTPDRYDLDNTFIMSALKQIGIRSMSDFHFGHALCLVQLTEILTVENILASGLIGSNELNFGNYSSGRFAWSLVEPVRYIDPVPMRGRQGLWTPTEADILALINARNEITID